MHIRARTWSSVAERAAQLVLRAPVLTTMRNPRRCAGDRGRYSSAWARSGTYGVCCVGAVPDFSEAAIWRASPGLLCCPHLKTTIVAILSF